MDEFFIEFIFWLADEQLGTQQNYLVPELEFEL